MVLVTLSLVTSAAGAQTESVNPFECACLGTQLIPYWLPVVAVIFVGTMYMLFFYEKPFPPLEDPTPPRDSAVDS